MAQGIGDNGAARGNRWSLAIWGGATLLLALPAVAMRFTTEVDWGPEDFITMGILLAAACGGYEVATRISGNTAYRAAVAVAIVTAFVTVWVNLAVGMIGNEDNPANLLFGGVLLVALLGAVLAWFRPRGMAVAMATAALAQGTIAVYALFGGHGALAVFIGLFVLPWLLSAHLFRVAARGLSQPRNRA